MSDLLKDIQETAALAVSRFQERAGGRLDFSEDSLSAIEELVDDASEFYDTFSEEQIGTIVEYFGCYILEVARLAFGGEYKWIESSAEPVLVTGEPACHIAIAVWGKVRGRLAGDRADNLPFFFKGFAEEARAMTPGRHVLFA